MDLLCPVVWAVNGGPLNRCPNTVLTREEMLQQVVGLPEYRGLYDLIGPYAEDTVQSIYSHMHRFAGQAFQAQQGGADMDMMRRGLMFESEMFAYNREDIEGIWQQALRGEFHAILRAEADDPSQYGAYPQDSGLTKAVKWIHDPSADRNPTTADDFVITFALETAELMVDAGVVETLNTLHQKLVPQQGLG